MIDDERYRKHYGELEEDRLEILSEAYLDLTKQLELYKFTKCNELPQCGGCDDCIEKQKEYAYNELKKTEKAYDELVKELKLWIGRGFSDEIWNNYVNAQKDEYNNQILEIIKKTKPRDENEI